MTRGQHRLYALRVTHLFRILSPLQHSSEASPAGLAVRSDPTVGQLTAAMSVYMRWDWLPFGDVIKRLGGDWFPAHEVINGMRFRIGRM
ncbi:hypothetical protein E2C01_075944 [Portunus trituberculatus]|uniref:Uncharacterized protein n=1 Tax=Portunus trituberculatus TaxID=210409 RepID=A0A5B7ILW8_PORTR|nr:hypothetical protein [Portunus trituberculatus]